MTPEHARAVNGLSVSAVHGLLEYFGIPPTVASWPSEVLAERQLGQVDAVLALLRLGRLADAESVVGRPVTRCPPCLAASPQAVASRPRTGDDRLILRVSITRNTKRPGWEPPGGRCYAIQRRLAVFRPGMSLAQALSRGVTRRDVRRAVTRGWIEVEQP
jgi:hypothetical protein